MTATTPLSPAKLPKQSTMKQRQDWRRKEARRLFRNNFDKIDPAYRIQTGLFVDVKTSIENIGE